MVDSPYGDFHGPFEDLACADVAGGFATKVETKIYGKKYTYPMVGITITLVMIR